MTIYRLVKAILLCSFIGNANAAIIFDSDGTSTFTLIDAGGMTISATTGPEPATVFTTGSGLASIDADSQSDHTLFPGDPLAQASAVSGSAGPGPGIATATALNGFLITLDNSASLLAATATFMFTYDWTVTLSKTDPFTAMHEMGFASAFFHITGLAPSGAETLAIDSGAGPMPVSEWLANPGVSMTTSDGAGTLMTSGSITVTAFVTVPGERIDAFSVITDATGAVSVTTPMTLGLISLGLLLLGRQRKT